MPSERPRIDSRRHRLTAAHGLLLLAAGLLAACATHGPIPGQAAHAPAQLILEPGLAVDTAALPPSNQILAVSPPMRAFLTRHVDRGARPGARLEQLLAGMVDQGLMALEYDGRHSRTAAETFAARSGNCLAFTNLFVALAREAGLDVRFQLVDVPPRWERDGRWVVLDDHINTVLHNIRLRGSYRHDYIVDFNIADFQGHYPRKSVSDEHAFALYYNNRAVELMREQRPGAALAHFRRAWELQPELNALWLNLGTLFRLQGDQARAQSAYLHALQLEPNNPAALSSLALLYRAMQQPRWADAVERRLASLREQNPYYYYQRALAAHAGQNWQTAAELIDRAIALKPEDPQFFLLRAQLAWRDGDRPAARAALQRAMGLAASDRGRALYAGKLDRLERAQGS